MQHLCLTNTPVSVQFWKISYTILHKEPKGIICKKHILKIFILTNTVVGQDQHFLTMSEGPFCMILHMSKKSFQGESLQTMKTCNFKQKLYNDRHSRAGASHFPTLYLN